MKLIMIHGRDQQGKDPKELRKTWIDTLKKGLHKSGLSLPDELEIIFPFYGDLLDSLVNPEQIGKTIEGIIAKGVLPAPQLSFFQDLLLEIAHNGKVSESQISASFTGPVTEKGPLNWEWVHTIIRAIDERTPWGDATLKRFTYDAFIYLTMPNIRQRINDFVVSAIDDQPCVVVGHSLGSVVGYDVLSTHKTAQVKKYITIGSPLGLRAMRSKLKTPIGMPACVADGWYNAYDDQDVVALNPLDSNYFDITPEIENNDRVNNGTDNHHGITGYLNDKAVAEQIYLALGL
jgi:hypothetical protein